MPAYPVCALRCVNRERVLEGFGRTRFYACISQTPLLGMQMEIPVWSLGGFTDDSLQTTRSASQTETPIPWVRPEDSLDSTW